MPDVPRSHLIAYVLAAVAVLGFGWRQVAHSRAADIPSGVPIEAGATASPAPGAAAPDGASAGDDPPAAAGTPGPAGGDALVVHVAGWVRRPGVYRLAKGLRVDDAVKAAGGARRGADLSQLNLAMELEDGRQILVARRGNAPPATAGSAAAPATGAASATAGAPAVAPVNLNTATAEQLDTLSGVGPVTAANIVAYRDEQGGFGSIDELGEIPGIGPVRLESLRGQVTL